MTKLKKIFLRLQLAIVYAAVCLLVNLLGIILTGLVLFLCHSFGLLEERFYGNILICYFAVLSLFIGAIVAVITSRFPLKPIRQLREATEKIANGDYSVHIDENGLEEIKQLKHSFNHMAQELQSVELLRNDFIGNFSHEFKTPIVSICGFAKALKWEELTPEERDDYLNVIIEESERLAELSANVLNLSKLEQQTIVTDKVRFNVSEQIRLAISVIDGKWSDKEIDYRFDSGEVFADGNKEMLRQVWINLLDNAVKFSPDGGIVEIEIENKGDRCEIAVRNQAEKLSPTAIAHIFDKFYQGDLSHATKGNGLGLTIVRRIVELHHGSVSAEQTDGGRITLGVSLPITR